MANFVFVLMVAGLFFSVGANECKSSTIGREFVFGILDMVDNCCHDSRNIITLDITNISPNNTRVRLQIPYFTNDSYFDIPTLARKMITINPDIQKDGTFNDSRGIKITSSGDITVTVTNAFNSGNNIDTYNIMPVTDTANDYVISSYKGIDRRRGSIILVAGVKNNTEVSLRNGNDLQLSFVLNSFDVYQYLCGKCDLTGTRVISNKHVNVVAGSSYTGIPDGTLEYIASEMFPTSAWSHSYIVAPVLPKSAFMIRIISESSFDVTITNQTRTYRLRTTLTDQYFGTEALAVTAKRPFSITQYGVNYDYGNSTGDPFMTIVPAVNQYINNYVFTVPRVIYGGLKHYIALIVPKRYKDGLVIDGQSIQAYIVRTTVDVPTPFDNFTIISFQVNEGYHRIYHSTGWVTFGVFAYGHGSELSYGFYAGYDLKGDCSAQTSTSMSTSTSTSTTTSASTSTTASTSTSTTTSTTTSTALSQSTFTHLPTTYSTASSLQSTGHICYNCEDLSHIDLCDTVKQCNTNEVCFVERYVDGGQTKYKTGCLQENTCEIKRNESRYSDDLCFECCHWDYCNNIGCGENGIPERNSRGPICFDCQHVSSPDECVNISPCESHQVCRIEEYKWFDHSHFKLGCGHGLCDPVNRIASHMLTRATPVCHSCCTDDYCNRNCTTSSQGQTGSVIVG